MKKFFKFIGILFLVLIVALVGGGYYLSRILTLINIKAMPKIWFIKKPDGNWL